MFETIKNDLTDQNVSKLYSLATLMRMPKLKAALEDFII